VKLLTGPETRLATLLDQPAGEVRIDPGWWSWNGAHGGLTVALLAAAMRRAAGGDVPLRSVNAQLLRPVREPLRLTADVVRRGRSVVVTRGTATQGGEVALTGSAVFGHAGHGPAAPAPPMPPSPPIAELDEFAVPLDVLPFAGHLEVHPVGPNRPFAGGDEAELTAWLRLDDDRPIDELRMILLMDGLAPSLGATMSAMTVVPTVELGLHLAPAVRSATSPWVLVRSRTRLAADDGWNSERLDAWGPNGAYYGTATQLRLTLG
jgi:hypothetical protein